MLRAAPMAAAGFFIYFTLALLMMHVIRPDYTIIDHMISDYAVGRSGWIMTSAFLSVSLGCLALAIGLFRDGPRSWLGQIGAGLLIVAVAGLIVTALFPTDLETAPSTRTGDIHIMSFLVNIVSVFVAALCLAVSYRRDPRWRNRADPALILTGLLAAAFVAQFLTLYRGGPYGITNRLVRRHSDGMAYFKQPVVSRGRRSASDYCRGGFPHLQVVSRGRERATNRHRLIANDAHAVIAKKSVAKMTPNSIECLTHERCSWKY